ncbi:MAG: NlpC/P60 family protein [Tissierellia bacterium]|nr:NlpC/P60 family protein [Tissierellia bacterium]
MNKGKIGLAFGLLAITSFAGIHTNALTEEPILAKSINKTVIENHVSNNSKYKIVKKENIKEIANKNEIKTASIDVEEQALNTYIEPQINNNEQVSRNPVSANPVYEYNNAEEVERETIVVEQKAEIVEQKPEIISETVEVHTSGDIAEEIEIIEDHKEDVKDENNVDKIADFDKVEEKSVAKKTEEVEQKEELANVEFTEVKTDDIDKAVEEKVEEDVNLSLSVKGWVTEDLNIRTNRGSSAEIIGVLEKGEEVSGEAEDGWIKINYNGMIGYISESYISTTEAVLPEEIEETVVEEVKEEPVIEENLTEEPEAEIIEEEKIVEEIIETPVEEAPIEEAIVEDFNTEVVATGDAIGDIVNAAYSLLGTNYVFSGSSPDQGFDCSGFTSYLYREYAGVELARVTTGQAGNGYSVSKDNIQPGDIILFQNEWSDYIDHVAIYVGEGNYIHAATEERGVVVDSTSGSYFQNNVVDVRRIIN